MKICAKCGYNVRDIAKFCINCGYAFPEDKSCLKCGAKLPMGAAFCVNCGTLAGEKPAEQPAAPVFDPPAFQPEMPVFNPPAFQPAAEQKPQNSFLDVTDKKNNGLPVWNDVQTSAENPNRTPFVLPGFDPVPVAEEKPAAAFTPFIAAPVSPVSFTPVSFTPAVAEPVTPAVAEPVTPAPVAEEPVDPLERDVAAFCEANNIPEEVRSRLRLHADSYDSYVIGFNQTGASFISVYQNNVNGAHTFLYFGGSMETARETLFKALKDAAAELMPPAPAAEPEPVPAVPVEYAAEPVPAAPAEPVAEPVPAAPAEPVAEPVPAIPEVPAAEPEPAPAVENDAANIVPTTMAELRSWYEAKGLPPYEESRFYIGDTDALSVFGIRQDGNTFEVFRNKHDGSRVIYFRGEDEASAVGGFYNTICQRMGFKDAEGLAARQAIGNK